MHRVVEVNSLKEPFELHLSRRWKNPVDTPNPVDSTSCGWIPQEVESIHLLALTSASGSTHETQYRLLLVHRRNPMFFLFSGVTMVTSREGKAAYMTCCITDHQHVNHRTARSDAHTANNVPLQQDFGTDLVKVSIKTKKELCPGGFETSRVGVGPCDGAPTRVNTGNGCADAGAPCRPRGSVCACVCLCRSWGRSWWPALSCPGPAAAAAVPGTPRSSWSPRSSPSRGWRSPTRGRRSLSPDPGRPAGGVGHAGPGGLGGRVAGSASCSDRTTAAPRPG